MGVLVRGFWAVNVLGGEGARVGGAGEGRWGWRWRGGEGVEGRVRWRWR